MNLGPSAVLMMSLLLPGGVDAEEAALAPGQFAWEPGFPDSGPVRMVVDLQAQRLRVYRDGKLAGISTISSGRPGHETPTGEFSILQKARQHRSNVYHGASMPWMQRLTWDGIALHAGVVPGHPASHGCVRLPAAFARQLFSMTRTGDIVVVVADADGLQGPALTGDGKAVPPAQMPVAP